VTNSLITPPPDNTIYQKTWSFTQVPGLTQSLTAPGMPLALAEYHKGWAGSLGFIPTDRPDMWSHFYNYYLNLIATTIVASGCSSTRWTTSICGRIRSSC
jgi:hypothetical protein